MWEKGANGFGPISTWNIWAIVAPPPFFMAKIDTFPTLLISPVVGVKRTPQPTHS